MVNQHLTPPDHPPRHSNVCNVLVKFPPSLRLTSWPYWERLVGILWSISLELPGYGSLFGHLQCALDQRNGNICLTAATHSNLQYWSCVINNLLAHPTHLLNFVVPMPMWHGTHDAFQWVLGGVLWVPCDRPRI